MAVTQRRCRRTADADSRCPTRRAARTPMARLPALRDAAPLCRASLSASYGFGDPWRGQLTAPISGSAAFGRDLSMAASGGYHVREREDDDLRTLRLPDTGPTPHRVSRQPMTRATSVRRFGRAANRPGRRRPADQRRPAHERGDASGGNVAGCRRALHRQPRRCRCRRTAASSASTAISAIRRTSLRVETAVEVADGHVAVGVRSRTALRSSPHPGLKRHHQRRQGANGYQAQTDFLGPALLPSVSPFTLDRVNMTPPSAAGYDGDGVFDLQPARIRLHAEIARHRDRALEHCRTRTARRWRW